jgi:hypothetical protein
MMSEGGILAPRSGTSSIQCVSLLYVSYAIWSPWLGAGEAIVAVEDDMLVEQRRDMNQFFV